jgi:hypothetical protein
VAPRLRGTDQTALTGVCRDLAKRRHRVGVSDGKTLFLLSRSISLLNSSKTAWGSAPLVTTTRPVRAFEDRRDEARAILAEIHGWFTEGFDTRDLNDAKALLNEFRRIKF